MKTENYIEYIRRELIDYTNIEYEDLYKTFPNDNLTNIFSTLHHMLISNFKIMNRRLPTNTETKHYWAEPSRELIEIIDTIKGLELALKDTEYAFSIDKYYEDLLAKVATFLSESGGSEIPTHMEKIELYYTIPLFNLKKTVSVKNSFGKQSVELIPIGEGSYAHVYKYKDDFYKKFFVIKRAKKNLSAQELNRFKIEYDSVYKFNSPYIVEVYKYIQENNEYIMEYMDIDLHEYIKKNNKLTKNQRLQIIRQLLRGIQYIHSKKLLHRDISPKNILLKLYDDVLVVKVSDFGWIKDQNNEMTNLDTEIKGAFNDFDNLSRVGFSNYNILHETFALTKIIAFVLTGKTNYSKIKDDKIRNFMDKGTSTDMDKRFQSIKEIDDYLKLL